MSIFRDITEGFASIWHGFLTLISDEDGDDRFRRLSDDIVGRFYIVSDEDEDDYGELYATIEEATADLTRAYDAELSARMCSSINVVRGAMVAARHEMTDYRGAIC